MAKWITVVELNGFLTSVATLLTNEERFALVTFLANSPEQGNVIPGTGGLRKLRWGSKGKGKRSGVRVIYYFYNETTPLFLLTAYAKNAQENLSVEQKKCLTQLANELKILYKN